jgi:hypothetical protein
MTEIAVLTPDAADPSYAGQWPGVLERLAEALATAGLTAVPTAWTDHIKDASGLMRFPLVLPVIAWGYHRDHDRWMQACATWQAAGVKMLNPPSVLAWNSDKSYLGRLADPGIATPDTVWIDGPTQADADAAFKKARSKLNSTARPWRRKVVDPSSHLLEMVDLVSTGVPSDPYENNTGMSPTRLTTAFALSTW